MLSKTVLAALVCVGFSSLASAKGWDEAIVDVDARARYLWQYALDRGASSHIGTMYNEIGVSQHTCATLGRMLGKETIVSHVEKLDDPILREGMTDSELHEVQVHAQLLWNWVAVVESLLRKTDDEQKYIWNLDCLGKFGIDRTHFVLLDDSTAKFRQSGSDLIVLGDIDKGFSAELSKWVEGHPETKRVVLGSGGGSVSEALLAGVYIRQRGFETSLHSNCYSACPLVFLGGVSRMIWSPYPSLGFHQVYVGDGVALPFNSEVYSLIQRYVIAMGADPDFVLERMFRASPSQMYEPQPEKLCEANVATWVQRGCTGVHP